MHNNIIYYVRTRPVGISHRTANRFRIYNISALRVTNRKQCNINIIITVVIIIIIIIAIRLQTYYTLRPG